MHPVTLFEPKPECNLTEAETIKERSDRDISTTDDLHWKACIGRTCTKWCSFCCESPKKSTVQSTANYCHAVDLRCVESFWIFSAPIG
ncbi:hypothetical protein GDO78_009843 [Eleutherodactylus coqui]|uniref:Uncharacterized protein n=1 Tax=Eleutherodactylus coqui TaxID=57060 RepID=A0A8J6FBT0_ELECQ|nr:hypothetical protein GDO78_009843 [Eleutherodactylus coqui]